MNYKYLKIKNPNTGRFVNINSKLGKNILQKYLRIFSIDMPLYGGTTRSAQNITQASNEFNFDGLTETDKETWLKNCESFIDLTPEQWHESIGNPLSSLQENEAVLEFLSPDMPQIVCNKKLCGIHEGNIPIKIIRDVWSEYVLSLTKNELSNMTKIIEELVQYPAKIEEITDDILSFYKNSYTNNADDMELD